MVKSPSFAFPHSYRDTRESNAPKIHGIKKKRRMDAPLFQSSGLIREISRLLRGVGGQLSIDIGSSCYRPHHIHTTVERDNSM